MSTPDTASTPDVVIVGGGIGGLGAAFALARLGLRIRVLEQAGEFGEVGAGIQLAPNCTRILDDYGLLDAAKARGVVPDRMVMRDAVDGTIGYTSHEGKTYRVGHDPAVLVVRPRGWHLPERHLTVDGRAGPGVARSARAMQVGRRRHTGVTTREFYPRYESYRGRFVPNDLANVIIWSRGIPGSGVVLRLASMVP